MDCQHSIAPSDEELLTYALDGEALSPGAQHHLEQCETCQSRLTRYQKANAFLVSRLYRSLCPSGAELSDYCSNNVSTLVEEERVRIACHIQECPLCAAEVEETRRFFRSPLVELSTPGFSPRVALRRIFATRVQCEPQFVFRGQVADASETAWPRQYRAESVDLSLHLSRTSSGEHMLLGILTSTDPAENLEALDGLVAELYPASSSNLFTGNTSRQSEPAQTPVPLLRTCVDDLGNIVFKPVPPGKYTLLIHLPDRELVIDQLLIEGN